jgi:predicted DCC family thiol-disulfide oxidoreductase YuxK
MTPEGEHIAPVLLYDGVCGFCNKTVRLLLALDKRRTLRFAALQSDYGAKILARHTELAGVDSVIYVENPAGAAEQVFARSAAALKIAAYLGGFWKIFLAAHLIPRPLRDALYDLIARYRYRFFGKHDACMLPAPEVRGRFLDV